jgi:hypothetical protein
MRCISVRLRFSFFLGLGAMRFHTYSPLETEEKPGVSPEHGREIWTVSGGFSNFYIFLGWDMARTCTVHNVFPFNIEAGFVVLPGCLTFLPRLTSGLKTNMRGCKRKEKDRDLVSMSLASTRQNGRIAPALDLQ